MAVKLRLTRAEVAEYGSRPTKRGERRMERDAKRFARDRVIELKDSGLSDAKVKAQVLAETRERYSALDPKWFDIINRILDMVEEYFIPALLKLLGV